MANCTLALLCLLVASCAAMPLACPAQSVSLICPQLKDHDGVTDAEADEEAEALPQGSAIYGEHVELKQIRETIESKCKAT